MVDIRDLSEQMWAGAADTAAVHPVHARYPEGQEIAEGVLFYKGLASANTVDTGGGLVMLDTGAVNDSRLLYEAVRRWRPDTPLVRAVFSHHHVDHIFGVGPFEQEAAEQGRPAPVVIGHAYIARNLDRYKLTAGWNTAINIRQFALPRDRFRWQEEYHYPDETYEDRHQFRVGDLTFDLRHGLGETEDATWTWIPERRILAPGDLFIWAAPNAGNPQKVQRFASDWSTALREMAALGPELMIPGHGLPIFGRERIVTALTDTADLLDSIERQVVAMMNTGTTLDYILHHVELRADLLEKPYLRPVYDDPQFVIRNIWRRYGGWYEGEPDNLLPAPRAQQAREWVALAGGLQPVLVRATDLAGRGDLRMACHLAEYAVLAEPGSRAAHELRRDVYAARARLQSSTMARNMLNHAALASEQGKRDLAGDYHESEG